MGVGGESVDGESNESIEGGYGEGEAGEGQMTGENEEMEEADEGQMTGENEEMEESVSVNQKLTLRQLKVFDSLR